MVLLQENNGSRGLRQPQLKRTPAGGIDSFDRELERFSPRSLGRIGETRAHEIHITITGLS
eukprot:5421383-Pyramimonas_sp.AAC.1